MKAWLQRVTEASVSVDGETIAAIGPGCLVLLGVTHGDTEAAAVQIARRICALRIFEDAGGRTNLSVLDTGGSLLLVPQFTLYADTAHGRRPGFSAAAEPALARALIARVEEEARALLGPVRVGTGRFGAHMVVRLVNDGPFSVEVLA